MAHRGRSNRHKARDVEDQDHMEEFEGNKAAEPADEKMLLEMISWGLYTGDIHAAMNEDAIQAKGITKIINCIGEDAENFHEETDGIDYLTLELEEGEKADIEDYFEEVYDYISEAKTAGAKVLVHCETGVDISPALVLSYMMTAASENDKELTLAKGIEFLQKKNPAFNVSTFHLQQLVTLEKELFGEASIRVRTGGNPKKGNRAKDAARRGGRGRRF